MGYYVNITESNITIPQNNYEKAVQVFKSLMAVADIEGQGGRWGPGGQVAAWYSWVDTNKAMEHLNNPDTEKGLLLFLTEWGYVFEDTDDGLSLSYKERDKWGDDEHLISCWSSLVNDGDYIRFRGEEGEHFGFGFRRGVMYQETGEVVWIQC